MKNTKYYLSSAMILITLLGFSCAGPQGDIGPKGDTGPAGTTGPRGETGAAGTAGTNGTNGTNGKDGATGATGPAGPRGETGATGAQGPKGDAGMANVIQITYGSRTMTGGSLQYILSGITQNQVNNSLIQTYITAGNGQWYALPGSTTSNEYRVFIYPSGLSIGSNPNPILIIARVSTSPPADVFGSTRIIIIPANDLRSGRKSGIDFNDYEAVKRYYGLKD